MRTVWAVAAALVLSLAGCGLGVRDGGAAGSSPFDERASQVLAAWRSTPAGESWTSGLIPLDPMDWVEGTESIYRSGDGDERGNAKIAIGSGWYRLDGRLPSDKPADTTVRFPHGGTLTVPVVTAAEAFAAIHRGDADASCTGAGCTLTVTGARLGTASIRTSRGSVEAPVWRFTVAELRVPVVRLAAGGPRVVALSEPALEWDVRYGRVMAVVPTSKATELTLIYEGGNCSDRANSFVHEEADAIVVGARDIPKPGNCGGVGLTKTIAVTLAAPLGNRVLLDATSGMPLALGDCHGVFPRAAITGC